MHFVNIDDSLEESEDDRVLADVDELIITHNEHQGGHAAVENRASRYLAKSFGSKSTPEPPEVFQIPELPHGQNLVINILSTWGTPSTWGLWGLRFLITQDTPFTSPMLINNCRRTHQI